MNVYSIPDSLTDAYHGDGWVLAAIQNDGVVALKYIEDIAPDILTEHLGGDHDEFFVRQWIQTSEAVSSIRELQALGQVSVGMCSNWEFVET